LEGKYSFATAASAFSAARIIRFTTITSFLTRRGEEIPLRTSKFSAARATFARATTFEGRMVYEQLGLIGYMSLHC
ncbi:MAG TPA: hypothetical protein VGI99_08040, partial [Gemmataceae bacterium]